MVMQKGNESSAVCPNCHGTMMQVMEEWICQKPCGFKSHDHDPVAWTLLNTLITLTNLTEQLCRQYGVVVPSSNIERDFKKSREL